MKKYPSQDKLKELFDYDPSGFLVWRFRPDQRACVNARFEGKIAGCSGIRQDLKYFHDIRVNGKTYRAACLIWIWHNGDIPNGFSVLGSNFFTGCKIQNLYLGSKNDRKDTQQIKSMQQRYKGVSERNGKYRASYDGIHIGTFLTKEAAASAVDEKIIKKHGEGASTNLMSRIDHEKYRVKKRTIHKKKRENGRMQGCYFDKRKYKPWYSKIGSKWLGYFKTQEEAARAYNIAAYDRYGENAVLNDIPDPLGELF